jgi:hypothetical protein
MRSSRVVVIVVALSVGVLGVAAADEGSSRKPPAKRGETLGKVKGPALEKYDSDRNGYLDVSERAAMRKDREARVRSIAARLYASYDANANGVLEPEETKAIEETRDRLRTASRGKARERYDANRNGVLDPDERQVMVAAREAWLKGLRARILERFDSNRNGVLDPEERQTMQALGRRTGGRAPQPAPPRR